MARCVQKALSPRDKQGSHFVKKRRIEGLFLNLLILLFSFFGGGPANAGELADRIVAVVNDDCITLSELNERLEPYVKNIDEGGYPSDMAQEMRFNVRDKVLNGMIDQKLADQEAKKLSISVGQGEVDQYLERTKSENFMTEEDLKRALLAQGFTLEGYREQVKQQILQVKLINIEVKSKIAVTENEIKDYYEKHEAQYQGTTKYHLRTIVMRVPPLAGAEEEKAARERIDSIEMALKTGGEGAFDELSQRFSGDNLNVTSRDLGLFTLDELSEKIREMVRGMKEGDITPVLETDAGYQILMLEEIKEEPGRTLEDARAEIQEKLYRDLVEEKYKAWVKKLRDRSYVKIIQ